MPDSIAHPPSDALRYATSLPMTIALSTVALAWTFGLNEALQFKTIYADFHAELPAAAALFYKLCDWRGVLLPSLWFIALALPMAIARLRPWPSVQSKHQVEIMMLAVCLLILALSGMFFYLGTVSPMISLQQTTYGPPASGR
jgi:type II secretory pathway component PulF